MKQAPTLRGRLFRASEQKGREEFVLEQKGIKNKVRK